ncbi:MAG: hypothetical protein QOF57_2448 [Frankiaceae bacterium]|jgi:diguanylate cyclase (GGDEF)-like protein/PAS domain S-box-containing protein|nr:hypothetical protein [Frankiaceae bacterium]
MDTGYREAYEAVFTYGLDGVLYTVPDGRILAANPAASELLRASAADICALGRAGWIDPADERWDALVAERRRAGRAHGHARMRRGDGSLFEAELVSNTFDVDGVERACIVFRDVTEQAEAARRLARAELQWRLTFDSAPTGIGLVATDGRWIAVNVALARIVGYDADELVGQPSSDVTHPDDRAGDIAAREELLLGRSQRYVREKRYVRKDGTIVWVKVSVGIVCDENNDPLHLVGHIEDVTTERERRQRLTELTWLDPLTRLVNRNRFARVVNRVDETETFAVLFLDLDNFKAVNDAHGHAAGDELLLAVAKRLTNELRDEDVAARLGGDEFAVLLRGISGPEEALAIGRRLLEILAGPYPLSDATATVTCSIGIAVAVASDGGDTGEERDPERLLVAADVAMYTAKRSGKNACHLSA